MSGEQFKHVVDVMNDNVVAELDEVMKSHSGVVRHLVDEAYLAGRNDAIETIKSCEKSAKGEFLIPVILVGTGFAVRVITEIVKKRKQKNIEKLDEAES